MKERPILFSSPMVKAIVDGRKTQTRRVIKPQPHQETASNDETYKRDGGRHWTLWKGSKLVGAWPLDANPDFYPDACPYGQPGDRLWVRETWMPDGGDVRFEMMKRGEIPWAVRYAASEPDLGKMFKWHPSIHMPRAASRLNLEITKVRVERVKDCSEADARAEGPEPNWSGALDKGPAGTISEAGWDPERDGYMDIEDQHYPEGCECGNGLTGLEAFEKRWNAINGKRGFGWEKNPWVWVIEFKRMEAAA